jgi:hypothetical protein
MTTMSTREQTVINWSTQEIDPGVKLGDKIADMLETDGGLFSAEDHATTDHEGIDGVPSITGLLDETAHDLLDHSGLTGVPSISGLLEAVPAANQAASTEQTNPTVTEFNNLLAKLKTAGLMVDDT